MKVQVTLKEAKQKIPLQKQGSPPQGQSGLRLSQKMGSPKINSTFSTAYNSGGIKRENSIGVNTRELEDQITILKQEVTFLKSKVEDASQREAVQKESYGKIINSLNVQISEKQSQSEDPFSLLSQNMKFESDQIQEKLKQAQTQKCEEYCETIASLKAKIDSNDKNQGGVEVDYKLLKKEFDYMQKDYQQQISHLRLENDRLRDHSSRDKERMYNEQQFEIEELKEKNQTNLETLDQKCLGQLYDIKSIHQAEILKLKTDLERVTSELKYAKFDIQELTSNQNIGERLESLHERYINEIEQLNELLSQRNGETQLLVDSFEREKEMVYKENQRLEKTLEEVKTQANRKQVDWQKKNSELRDKLDKAFEKLTAMDESLKGLQDLRTQIKKMQENMTSQQSSITLSANKDLLSSANKNADILQKQVAQLKMENSKLKTDMKKVVDRTRSASPPITSRRQTNKPEQMSKNYGIQDSAIKESPQILTQRKITDSSRFAGDGKQSVFSGFLKSQKAKPSALNVNELSTTIHSMIPGGGDNQSASNSCNSTPQNNNIGNDSRSKGDRIMFKYQKESSQNSKQQFYSKNQSNMMLQREINELTLASLQSDPSIVKSGYGKNMTQSLSSNQLLFSPSNFQGNTFKLLDEQIALIQCKNCQNSMDFMKFLQHSSKCSLNIEQNQKKEGLPSSRLAHQRQSSMVNISPIKSRNDLQQKLGSVTGRDSVQLVNGFDQKVRKVRDSSYNDEECSTELGYKSVVGGQNHHLNPNQIRPSFLSSNEYNSFMDRGLNFSPELFDRSNFQGTAHQNSVSQYANNTMAGLQIQEKKMLEDKVKLYESMYRQLKTQCQQLEKEASQKQSENDRLINDLKTTKVQIALLEESTSDREHHLKKQLDMLFAQQQQKDYTMPEVVVNLHTTNVSCFNIGRSQVTNQHELQIGPTKFLQKAAQDMRNANLGSQNGSSPILKQTYSQNFVHTEEDQKTKQPQRKDQEIFVKQTPKRLRSQEKQPYSSCFDANEKSTSQGRFSNGKAHNVSQDIKPDNVSVQRVDRRQPIVKNAQRGVGSPVILQRKQPSMTAFSSKQ